MGPLPPVKLYDLKGLEGIFTNVVNALLALGGVILFVMLIIGGFNFIFAGGDPKKIEAARKTLTYAIGGLVLVAVSYLILLFIQEFTGVPVTQFKVTQ